MSMPSRVTTIVSMMAPAILLSACGDLQSPEANLYQATYTRDGNITTFLSRVLVTFDGSLKSEQSRVTYPGPPEGAEILQTALSGDGRVAAIGWTPSRESHQYTTDVFTSPGSELLFTFTEASYPLGLQLDATGSLFAFYNNPLGVPPQLRVVDLATKTQLWAFSELERPAGAVFSPDGNELYGYAYLPTPLSEGGITYANKLVAWHARSGALRFEVLAPQQEIDQLGISPDGTRLISGLRGNPATGGIDTVVFLSTADGQLLQSIPVPDWTESENVMTGAISSTGHWAALIHNPDSSRIVVWDPAGAVLYSRPARYHGSLSFSPDGSRLLLTPPVERGIPGVIVYDVVTGDVVVSRRFTVDAF